MPFYHQLGEIPHKRHTQFRKTDGGLYREELMGTEGFTGRSALLYHHHPPTAAVRVEKVADVQPQYTEFGPLRHRHFCTHSQSAGGDPVTGRRVLLGNGDCTIALCRPTEPMHYFYRNSVADEVIFVHEGHGRLESVFGTISYREGDYLVVPVGTTYRLLPDTGEARLLVIEAIGGSIESPRRYRNEFGQLLEHAPYCERDIRPPAQLETHLETGEHEVRVKGRGMITAYFFPFHPCDVVGWDGYLFPYAFNIADFEPITGRVHQPPPVHQTFQGPNFVVCSFVPRLFDYHPLAIPAPYVHSNVHSDEVIYYVDGNFMSRKGIAKGSVTLHPNGVPHGPHPGTVEESIGKRETQELAVMVDTFHPLQVAAGAVGLEDDGYHLSWREFR